jgi:GNAT superfamily N-acetyltransferase
VSTPTANVSVRPAVPSDAVAVARVQQATWRAAYAEVLPPEALELDLATLEAAWSQAIWTPATEHHRLLVALEGADVVGIAASEPTEDGTELTVLLVEPRWGRRGHGSRLLAAAADHWRGDGVQFAVSWVFETDAVVSAFLESAGWAPETVGRTLESGETVVRQRRWHTSLC